MKLCMGCMKNIEDHITQCPYCGYDESVLRQESYYLDPGTIIGGKYIVGRVIKYGGYTISYLGMDAEKNRKVMIKEYLPSDFSTRSDGEKEVTIYSGDAAEQYEQGLTAFLNEANRIQQLDHVAVIEKIYDCVAENDTGYVISEYVEGQTMNEVLDRGKVFSPAEAKDVISQILIGLNQVHPLNIIHCNISPETIMFTNDGGIKLLDFGATRYVTTANSKSLAILLKQGYAPEEQYRSRGERGPWTDVYALAAVMYRMITGNVPVESVDRALQDELKEPSRLGIEIPQNMENALMNALNIYQKDRTPSADAFLRELSSSQVVRIRIKKRGNDTGKLSKWAKGLIASLFLAAGIGGIVVYHAIEKQKIAGDDDTGLKVVEIIGKDPEEIKEELEERGYELKEEKVQFDRSKEEEEIIAQNPPPGTKGKIIKYTLSTNRKCNYGDLSEKRKSAYSLAEYLNLPKKVCDEATKGIGGKDAPPPDDEKQIYGKVYGIKFSASSALKGKFLFLSEIEKEENAERIITLSDIQTIYFYTSPFLYNKMGDPKTYKGKNIKDIMFDKCVEKNGKVTPTGMKESPPVNAEYYSFLSDYEEGDVVESNYEVGEIYDARAEAEVEEKGAKVPFETVKKQIQWYGKKPDVVADELEKDEGFIVKYDGDGASGDRISNIYAKGYKKGEGKLFVKSSKTTIVIETAKVTPTPKPTPVPTLTPTQKPAPKPATTSPSIGKY